MVIEPVATRSLEQWFESQLSEAQLESDIIAYVAGVLASHARTTSGFLGKTSVVKAFIVAREKSSFELYQRTGDWVLWLGSCCPDAFEQHRDVYEMIGSQSYSACSKILRHSWPLYGELSRDLPRVVAEVETATRDIVISG